MSVYWSTDRIIQPCLGRRPCVAPVEGVRALQAIALYQEAVTGVLIVILPGPRRRHTAQNLRMYMYSHREKHLEMERLRHKMRSNKLPINWSRREEREKYIET